MPSVTRRRVDVDPNLPARPSRVKAEPQLTPPFSIKGQAYSRPALLEVSESSLKWRAKKG